jgi:hypothetical protein
MDSILKRTDAGVAAMDTVRGNEEDQCARL